MSKRELKQAPQQPARPPLPKVQSALGALESSSTRDSLAGIKTRLLSNERRNTTADIRYLGPRIVRFDRTSPLADLAYIAQPGLTSRVAKRTFVPRGNSSAALGGLGHTSSYLRLSALDSGGGASNAAGYDVNDQLDGEFVEEGSGFTPALRRTVGVALLSSFQFGYNNGNMNTQAGVQRAALGIANGSGASADNVWALCVSLFCVGALLGCNLSGSLADAWGRRRFLLVSAAVYLVGGLLEMSCALPAAPTSPSTPAWTRIGLLVLGRLVTGVACGGSTVVVPMYLGEVSPAHLRGMLGTAFQLTCVIAMTLAQVLGLSSMLGTAELWPCVLGFVALPALLQLALGGLLIESPRWHCARGSIDDAQATLTLLRDAGPADDTIIEELDVMLAAADARGSGKAGPGLRALVQQPTRWPLFISMCVMVLQQFSGINNAFNYSTVFLRANGMAADVVQAIAILMNVMNVFVTLLSVYLMDRAGRRALLLVSTAGMAAATCMLTVALQLPGRSYTTALSVTAVICFVATFGIGLGPIPWLLPAEILPGETRALASSVTASTNWLANFIASQAFLVIANSLGGFAFVPFGVCLVLGVLFVARVVPETKGKSLEQIQSELAFS